eukprot:COSAG02_NODE_26256_length_637_cov_0.877323_2_plen_39_part_01
MPLRSQVEPAQAVLLGISVSAYRRRAASYLVTIPGPQSP